MVGQIYKSVEKHYPDKDQLPKNSIFIKLNDVDNFKYKRLLNIKIFKLCFKTFGSLKNVNIYGRIY